MKHMILAPVVALALSAGAANADTIRFATFNASMNRFNPGDLTADLLSSTDAQISSVAETLQRLDADVVLINEFDYDPANPALFQDNYLSQTQSNTALGASTPISYAHNFIAPSNTGLASGEDLDNNGTVDGPTDAQGFGFFEGQFGMTVYSKYEILTDQVRTFQSFLWKDMPGARLPSDPSDADGNGDTANWYTDEELDIVRLSSKSHWDVPIKIDGEVVHFLVSHPTPPVFDGPEDRNGLRNADEIRFWSDYISGADYIYDDSGVMGGLEDGAHFVVAGDLNSDPFDGDSVPGAAQQLLENPLVNTTLAPTSAGGTAAAARQGGANSAHTGDPAEDTADFSDVAPGNLRVDYVLPSTTLELEAAGVFWFEETDSLFALNGEFPFPASDHRAVYADVRLAPVPVPASALLLAGAFGLAGVMLRRRR